MGEQTKIEWCDRSASPWHGCSRVHAGCDNCYAEAMAGRNPKTLGVWGENGTRVKSKSFVANLRKWNREAEARGEPSSVFPSICDPFEDRPELVPWRNEMFATIDACPWIRLLLLTKRPENVRRMWPDRFTCEECGSDQVHEESGTHCHDCGALSSSCYRHNCWLLTSVSDQPTAEAMITELLKCRDLVPVLGVSAEPLLGPVDFTPWLDQLDWVIVGGESGPKARPCDLAWIRSIVAQCKTAGVACFVKQLGAMPVERDWSVEEGDHHSEYPLRDHKGGDWSEWPEDLRVREWPKGGA